MTLQETVLLVAGALVGFGGIPLLMYALGCFFVQVGEEEAVLVTRFGKLAATLREPGLHTVADRLAPWVSTRRVSLRRDFREIEDIRINDSRGTTVVVDIWLELRIVDPARATFEIVDWDRALTNVVSHSVISILGNREFKQILRDRNELARLVQEDLSAETARWGLAIELVFIRNVSLLPEVSEQIFASIAAKLERAKARIEEEGRQKVALLEAETSAKIATLVGKARGQYPAAIGRAFSSLEGKGRVLAAYNELYELSKLRPHQTITFRGWKDGELRAADAAMLAPGVAAAEDAAIAHAKS
jgi:regulator of protease activity HflC (stomatin/prohibitin superfamily)